MTKSIAAEIERNALGQLLDALDAFYENPVNQQAYKAWKKEKEDYHHENDNRARSYDRKPGKT